MLIQMLGTKESKHFYLSYVVSYDIEQACLTFIFYVTGMYPCKSQIVIVSNWFSFIGIDDKWHLVSVHSTFKKRSKAYNKHKNIWRWEFWLVKYVLCDTLCQALSRTASMISFLIGRICPGKGTLPMPNQAGKLSLERNGGYTRLKGPFHPGTAGG